MKSKAMHRAFLRSPRFMQPMNDATYKLYWTALLSANKYLTKARNGERA